MIAAKGDTSHAFGLYCWNMRLSSAVYESLHLVEVVLRNAMDGQLRVWSAETPDWKTGKIHGRQWLLDTPNILEGLLARDLTQAREYAAKAVKRSHRPHRPVEHDDVVAQLGLGSWRFLLPNRNADKGPSKQTLWDDALVNAFPNLEVEPETLVDDVSAIHILRNRVAHLEPLLQAWKVDHALAAMDRTLRAIEPTTAAWHATQQRVTEEAELRPEGRQRQRGRRLSN